MKVVVAVTGSIAAYKAVELVRMFVKRGDDTKTRGLSYSFSTSFRAAYTSR